MKEQKIKICTQLKPAGDQNEAIKKLAQGIDNNMPSQVLLGATGTGKTFTMAKIIEKVQRPTLVIAHNKTLAAQLASEFKSFFPNNAVEYFVSYYDYYQPEAYIPRSDIYIEKSSSINDEIEKMRHSATCSLAERQDVIIVSSVSCIYGLGAPKEYYQMVISLRQNQKIERNNILRSLVENQYQRNDITLTRGTFQARGDIVNIFPVYSSEKAIRIQFLNNIIENIYEFNPITGEILSKLKHIAIYPASHYVTSKENMERAAADIEQELNEQVQFLKENNKQVEPQRLKERVSYDLEMMLEMGYCSGIENYARHINQLPPGNPPYTLLDYFPENFIVFIDESHVTVPQIRAMYHGDHSRKKMLIDYGFRLPSAFDNRPLTYREFTERIKQIIYVSATPNENELKSSSQIVEQVIRPTGLIDPVVIVKPIKGQIDDLLSNINIRTTKNERVLITTLTKKMVEELTDYFIELNIKVKYLHSDINTIERTEIIQGLRKGDFDVLIGVNLLREGLDLPEVSLVAILDADKEGFLRSETSLIQTIGRAARNINGTVIMYADKMTDSMQKAINETERRRLIQIAYNIKHNITPKSIEKSIKTMLERTTLITDFPPNKKDTIQKYSKQEAKDIVKKLQQQMQEASKKLEFETAAQLRDAIFEISEFYKLKI